MPIDLKSFEQLKTSGDLPSPRGVALAIIRLTSQDEATLLELTRVVRTDPAFVGRLIKAANGMVATTRRPVVSVQEALMVLGMPAVRNMALGFSLLSNYRQGGCKHFDYEGFWSGSLLIALAAQSICLKTRAAAADEMFSLGLLARVGELALATLHPVAYGAILEEYARFPQLRLIDLEQGAFAMDHRELGAAMLSDWGVPRVFSEPAFYLEMPERAEFPEGSRQYAIAHTLALGRLVAAACLCLPEERSRALQRVFEQGSVLGLDAEFLVSVCDRVGKEWLEWSPLLKLDVAPLPDFSAFVKVDAGLPDSGGAGGEGVAPRSEGERDPDEPTGPLRVLVADSDAPERSAIVAALRSAGHEVFEAGNDTQALAVAVQTQPHMMIVDFQLQGNAGLALVRALRKTRFGRTLYVLMLTAVEDESRVVEAFESGVDDYALKPFGLRMLTARLRAGQRVVRLQLELERDREEIRHYAAELSVSNRRLQEAALTDPLTGFPNRRYAIERIEKEWSAAQRSRRPLSCMVIDLDNFKQINDQHGHDAGDRVLCAVSAAFRSALRAQDVIARTGGDEFLVICPETSLEAALLVGERLRAAIDRLAVPVTALGQSVAISCSIGVAVREERMPDPDMLIKRADEGAYAAKHEGRNRVASVQRELGVA